MSGSFNITFLNEAVGTAEMRENGLYYEIHCVCAMNNVGLYRVRLEDGNTVLDLGTCLRINDRYEIQTKLPKSRLSGSAVRFVLTDGETEPQERFVPIIAGEPFSYLTKLPVSLLEVTDNTIGIRYPMSDQQGSDRSQVPH